MKVRVNVWKESRVSALVTKLNRTLFKTFLILLTHNTTMYYFNRSTYIFFHKVRGLEQYWRFFSKVLLKSHTETFYNVTACTRLEKIFKTCKLRLRLLRPFLRKPKL